MGEGLAIGEGEAGEEAMSEIEGDEGFAGARLGGKEGDEATRDPTRPKPGDGYEAGSEAAEAGVVGG